MIRCCVWMINTPGYFYRCQLDNLNLKNRDKHAKIMAKDGWQICSEIFYPKEVGLGLIFTKDFGDRVNFYKWAKNFTSYQLKELHENGREDILNKRALEKAKNAPPVAKKKVKIKLTKKSKTGRQNICSHCGKLGHNKRTCPKLRGAK